jgi:ferredoxin
LRRSLPRGLLLRGREHARHTPDECIDCEVCESECPVDAIKPDTEPALDGWLDINRQYSEVWPNITTKKPAPADADAFVSEPEKFDNYFSVNPGEGD